ncbi:PEP/pyruvate-binding domain-containing protein [Parapedobacter tibetensis]|uniref:PEP/pyruvate-binding domain-containing protein n=1 Tax=Parapedobacter tibetensis TaxID=2972951 RepID=UPI00214D40C9|nr:PEP/pyruvate-binding domain-containing protein [Parapedobacter tibetensis]
MIIIRDIQHEALLQYHIGGKASNLHLLGEAGLNIPRWVVIPANELVNRLPFGYEKMPLEELRAYIQDADIPEWALKQVTDYFPDNLFLAVRSSAVEEDGEHHSYAGQFESHLFVTRDSLDTHIKKVWSSAFSDRARQYALHRGEKPVQSIAVIVQAMVPAEVSGVAFGVNPVTGNRKENVINAVYGLGEGLVSGALDADQYIVNGDDIQVSIANKTQRLTLDWENGGGTHMEEVEPQLHQVSSLDTKQVREVCHLLDRCQQHYGTLLDIEFAFADDTLYLLQVRPVTNLENLSNRDGEYILWDNSNIIESYPGVTTPLTFSFVSKSYEGAYKLFCRYLGVSSGMIGHHGHVFANTLGLIKGRIYYNLKTWYHMLAMLPGYSINARYMEKMMGVKERFDIPESYRLSKLGAWWAIFKMGLKMLGRFIFLPWTRQRFIRLLNKTIAEYKAVDFSSKDANELMHLYLHFEHRLLNEWKAPLLNDFFAMIAFGTLEKQCHKLVGDNYPNIHNDLLCGSADIISTQPIHRCIALADQICATDGLKSLFLTQEASVIWRQLQMANGLAEKELKALIDVYIHDFGERCVGELKLETVSYTQQPALFIKLLQSYVKGGITADKVNSDVEERLRGDAEQQIAEALKGKPLKKLAFGWLLRRTRSLVSARENLRYERTRAFGIVREIFTHMGGWFHANGIIEQKGDIFYLGMEEIFAYIDGRSIMEDIKVLIALRKAEFEAYRQQSVPAERFATYGPVYHANDIYNSDKEIIIVGDLHGVGCCPGRVKAKVRVVLDPTEVGSLEGDILVTSSTDPGWTTLFPSASGIIVERGSLLSHSAIVSREMGKPCIVGVTGLLKRLKTGDEVEMDGSTGEIRLIREAL